MYLYIVYHLLCFVTVVEGTEEVLVVKELDQLLKENGTLHHTEQYDIMEREKDPLLVVRRGQGFLISITLSREYNAEKDAISFIFTVKGM